MANQYTLMVQPVVVMRKGSLVNVSIAPSNRRARATAFIDSKGIQWLIAALILINAVTLGLETNQEIMLRYGSLLYSIDFLILLVFTIELSIRFFAYRGTFFKNGWNWFDLIIVIIAWIPASGAFAILRALRILRVLRLISVIPQMRRVISAIGHSIPGMISIVGVLVILFYVCAVLATKLFGHHPDPLLQEWFGSLGASAYTLFQIMTLESWSMGIVRPVMEHYPWAWLFFVPFIVVTSFAVLNLFIGIIVDAMQAVQNDPEPGQAVPDQDKKTGDISTRLELLQQSIDELHEKLAARGPES